VDHLEFKEKKMAEFTRVNPVLATNANGFGSGRNHDELYSTLQLKVFTIDTGADISAQNWYWWRN
jgi:hypothetical protein